MKKKYLIIGIFSIIIALILTTFYRPFIYNNKINDGGFADVIGSLFSVFTFCTLVWSLKDYSDREKNIHILLAIIIYGPVWEFFGYFKIYGTFDIKDVFAAIISGVIAYLLKLLLKNRNQEKLNKFI